MDARLVISVAVYWTVVVGLLGFAILRFKSNHGHQLAIAASFIAAYLVGAAIFPVVATPWVIVSYFTNTPFYPFHSKILVLRTLSYQANQSLLERNNIRVATIEYRFAIDGQERAFLTTLRCAKRYGVFGELAEWRMRQMETATGGELTGTLGNSAITVHGVPNIMHCHDAEQLREGPQRTPLNTLRSAGYVAVSVIDRMRNPPLVATFNLTDSPLQIRGITAFPPDVISIAKNGHITREELQTYAPPFRIDRDNGGQRPPALRDFKRGPEWHADVPIADFVTTSGWCDNKLRKNPATALTCGE